MSVDTQSSVDTQNTPEARDARGEIMEAAREGFAMKGYYGTSMGHIVKKTGLSKGAIYWYFPGKWEIYKEVVMEQTQSMIDVVIPKELSLPREEVADYLISRGERLIDMLAEDSVSRLLFVQLMLDAMRGREEMMELAASLRESITEDAVSILDSIFPDEPLRVDSLSHRDLVGIFVSVLNGLIMNLELMVSRDDAKKSWRFLVERVFGGVGIDA
ncbi:MAG: TetR/AcrR family transcriptional regulator [Synergistaceae bacterium]|nr:TetR/AcrR family transcriptional regulator [Synergistota bacterium]NLM72171.1 TetR/AcrR family transcriptional regulator [Synergistaceae bacterium]